MPNVLPPPPELRRQSRRVDPDPTLPSGMPLLWWLRHYETAHTYWENAKAVFPEYFEGDIRIAAVRVTPNELQEIRDFHSGYDPSALPYQTSPNYLIGDHVGKIRRHVIDDPIDEHPGDIMYTPMSYYSYSAAMYEASLMAQESVKSVVRHLAYTAGLLDDSSFQPTMDLICECICEYGRYPSLDNVRELGLEPRQEE